MTLFRSSKQFDSKLLEQVQVYNCLYHSGFTKVVVINASDLWVLLPEVVSIKCPDSRIISSGTLFSSWW